jgi:hypothetical protein
MLMSPLKKLFDRFLSNLKTISEQKGFDFDLRLIKRYLQLYCLNDRNKPYFLFIHASLSSFWEISSNWQEITHLIPSENTSWAVVLLQKPDGENDPMGFLISSNDFVKMKSGFGINRMGRIKIHERDLSLKNRFNNWDGFFQLLNLETGLNRCARPARSARSGAMPSFG